LKKLFGDTQFFYAIIKRTPNGTKCKCILFFSLSVIQTGFVETLKPQFVPGQVMAGSAAAANLVEEKLSHLQLVQENDNLKSQVNFVYNNFDLFFLLFSRIKLFTLLCKIMMYIHIQIVGT